MRHIGIVGTAPSCRDIAPWDDKSIDFWVCSPGNAYGVCKRVTVWFEIHSLVEMTAPENKAWSVPYFKWLRDQPFPVYMQEKNDYVPNAIVFPYKKMIEFAGTRNWFTSTPAFMLCKCEMELTEGDEVSIFGIDMCADQEHYTGQKAGLIYWIERLQKKGINVTIPLESCLGAPVPVYGYNESSRFGRRLNVIMRMLNDRAAHAGNTVQNAAIEQAFCNGAIEQLKYFIRTWVDGANDAEIDVADIEKHVATFVDRAKANIWPKPDQAEIDPHKMRTVLSPGGVHVPKSAFEADKYVPRSAFPEDRPTVPAMEPDEAANDGGSSSVAPKPRRRGKTRRKNKTRP